MTNDEKTQLVVEIFENTLDFLSSEFTLQLKHKKNSFFENREILDNVMVLLFVNHVINASKSSDLSPIEIFKKFNIEKKINQFLLTNEICADCKKIHE